MFEVSYENYVASYQHDYSCLLWNFHNAKYDIAVFETTAG
jgi:hypothetical protein